jgi:CHASE2 domain
MLQLHIQHIADICHFRLEWGNNQKLNAQLPYPTELFKQYKIWQTAYLHYYAVAKRGRPGPMTALPLLVDPLIQLRDTEAIFLESFQTWLNHEKLLPIRSEIAKASQTTKPVDLFITGEPIDIDRLPWETWNLTADFPVAQPIRITRVPANISAPALLPKKRPKLRILAILGDPSRLDFKEEEAILKTLKNVAEVRFVGYQSDQDNSQLRAKIRAAIVDEGGWDILFFAGHSNEKPIVGGELGIAPGESISIQEISPDLQIAKEKGLQLAFFNSCTGLDIANSLINLGLSQVVIMREPVHNSVAQKLFVSFIKYFIRQHQDFHQALISACYDLKTADNLDCPSSHWIASLFRHPGASLPKLPLTLPERLKRQWMPTRWETGVLASLACLSLFDSLQIDPLQNKLLDRRTWFQAIYRDVTHQLPPQATPPVRIISIDEASLKREQIINPNPIPWGYLSRIIDRLKPYHPRIIGLDYVLDAPKAQPVPGDVSAIGKSVRSLVETEHTWFTLAGITDHKTHQDVSAHPDTGIEPFGWVMQGNISSHKWFLPLPDKTQACEKVCRFTYLLAASARLRQDPNTNFQPQIKPKIPFQTQVVEALQQNPDQRKFNQRSRSLPVTDFSYNLLGQYWLRPIYDFSISPDRVYETTSAKELLEESNNIKNVSHIGQQVILITAGGYAESGLDAQHSDYRNDPPSAMSFWTPKEEESPKIFTGGQANAYAIHHLLNQHFVIPIPDLWMLLVTGIVAKQLTHIRSRNKWLLALLGGSSYSMIALQVYVAGHILIPIVIPIATIVLYQVKLPPRK